MHAHFITNNIVWVWERDANINWSMVSCQGSTVSNYLEIYWPFAVGLLTAVNSSTPSVRNWVVTG